MWVSVQGGGSGAWSREGVTSSVHSATEARVVARVVASSVHTPETHQYFSCREVQTDVNTLSGGAGARGLLGSADTEILPKVTLHTRVWVDVHVWMGRAVGGKSTGGVYQGLRQARAQSREHVDFLLR